MASLPVCRQICGNSCDLCHAWQDLDVMFTTMCCPCNTAGLVAKKKGKSCPIFGCLSIIPLVGILTRAMVRSQVNGSPLWEDCIIHCCCGGLALCQEGRKTGLSWSEIVDFPASMKK